MGIIMIFSHLTSNSLGSFCLILRWSPSKLYLLRCYILSEIVYFVQVERLKKNYFGGYTKAVNQVYMTHGQRPNTKEMAYPGAVEKSIQCS